ncbi:porin family protein [Hymenobacter elongatus]|nr:outer membrane beta-barrel protein [Hymenobacter elongatus]
MRTASYYVRKNAEGLQALIQRDTTVSRFSPQSQQQTTVRERHYPFRTVLWAKMADCPAAQVLVQAMELKESQLVKAVAAYNACAGNQVQYTQPIRASRVRFSVLALGHAAWAILPGLDGSKIVSSDKLPSGGVGLDFAPAFLNPKLTLHLQVLYFQQLFSSESVLASSPSLNGTDVQERVRLELNAIQIPALVRYTYPKGAVRPYFQVGPMLSLHTHAKAQRYFSYKTTTGATNTYADMIELRGYTLGLTAGAGVAVPVSQGAVLSLEVRGEGTDGISATAGRIPGKRGVSIVAGFTFGK